MYTWLSTATRDGGLVLTSSRRLARELAASFDESQLAAGQAAWLAPEIHYWQDWLANALQSAEHDGLLRLLGTSASAILWEDCLSRTGDERLLSKSAVVRHARQAWQRLAEWQLSLDDVAALAASRDEHWFVRAARAYRQQLQDDGWIDRPMLAGYCRELFKIQLLPLPQRTVHSGFDRLTPALQQLFGQLESQGVNVTPAPPPARQATCRYSSFTDNDAQWRAAGRWARQCLEQDPHARVAVIAPDLESNAGRILRLVREGFAPGWQLGGAAYRASVNVSYGQALASFPLIATARRCLQLAAGGLQSADVSLLLRSQFLGDDDLAGRSRLELRLRSLPDRRWPAADLLAALNQPYMANDGQAWRSRLQAVVEFQDEGARRLRPGQWAERMDRMLAEIGWPGSHSPDSDEFQLLNRWRELLNEFAQLEFVRASFTLTEAVERLFRIAADTVYQPETPAGGLNVLGMLETAGIGFDHLWIGGLDASRWPPAGHPLALVNRQLQRQQEMPDATPADTLAFAKGVLERLRQAATTVQLSWSVTDGDAELLVSPLLTTEGRETHDDGDPGWHARGWLGGAALDVIEPDPVPAVSAGEQIHGGSGTLQKMREEPFSAFVAGRLAVAQIDAFEPGLTARLRGIALHAALGHLLLDCKTQDQLQGWTQGEREQRAADAAGHAVKYIRQYADTVLQRVLQLETRRLERLLLHFMDLETERDAFAIEHVEEQQLLHYGAVTLKLRADRIDRMPDGSLLILDYKSGTRKRFLNAHSGMPATVQLSVYAFALDDDIGGLGLVNIDSREIRYDIEGAAVSSGRIKAEDWSARLGEWRVEVKQLLQRFAAGEAGVNTQQSSDNARPFALLSRVEEMRRGE